MATKRIYEEDINLNIRVNGNQAQKEIYELETANRKLKEEIKGWEKELKKVGSAGKGMGKLSQEYKDLEAKIKTANNTIAENNSKLRNLHSQLNITEMTMGQLRTRAQQLRLILKNMVPGSDQYKKLNAELSEVNQRMTQLNTLSRAQSLSWSSAANWLNKYQTMIVGFAASITGMVFTLQRWIDYSGKLADQQAFVMKTTGMTRAEIDELTRSLSELDTRSSRMDLLKIAQIGGQMGIVKEEMSEFVKVIDQVAMTFSDTFTGGVEEVTEVIGKLKFLYSETELMGISEGYNKIGSAITMMGQSGIATDRNVAEFMTRVGSLPQKLKPSIQEAAALGAVFEESGITAERAGRAYGIFIKTASSKIDEFAQVMGLTTDKAKELFNTNPTEFFLDFTQSLQKLNPSGVELAKILKTLGVNAVELNKMVGVAMNSNERFRQQILLSNDAFEEGTLLMEQYNVMNNNLQANLEKIRKEIAAWTTSKAFMDWLGDAVTWFAKLIGATEDYDGAGKRWRNRIVSMIKILAVLGASMVSYRAALILTTKWQSALTAANRIYNLVQTRTAVLSNLQRSATLLLASAKFFLTGNITRATAAMRLFNTTVRANPLGLLLTAITAVAGAIWYFKTKTDDAAQSQKSFNESLREAHSSAAQGISKTIARVNDLITVIKSQNVSLDTQKKAYQELIKINPIFNGLLKDEKFNIEGLNAAYRIYISRLQDVSHAKATAKLREEAAEKVVRAESELVAVETQLAIEQKKLEDLRKEGKAFTTKKIRYEDPAAPGRSVTETVQVQTEAYKKQIQVIKDLESQQKSQISSLSQAQSVEQQGVNYTQVKIKAIDDEINALTIKAEAYEKIESEIAQNIAKGARDQIKHLEMVKSVYLGMSQSRMNTDEEEGTIDLDGDKKDKSKKDKEKQERERRIKELLDANKKLDEELLILRRSTEDEMFKIQDESFRKQQDLLELNHKRKIEDLKRTLVDEETFRAISEERAKASAVGDTEKIRLLDEYKDLLTEKNAEINNAILQEELKFLYDRDRLHAEFAQKELSKKIAENDKRKQERERAFNEELIELGSVEAIKERLKGDVSKRELANIRTWEDAKAALKRQYQQADIEAEIAYLTELKDEMQRGLESGMFGDISIEFMTEEEKEKILSQLDDVESKILDLLRAKQELQNGQVDGGLNTYGMGGSMDIFGMTPENWQVFIQNVSDGQFALGEMIATVGLLQNAFSQYFAIVQAGERRNLDLFNQSVEQKKRDLKRQLDTGIIDQEAYQNKIEKLEEKAELQRKKMQYEAAMREWRMQLSQAFVGQSMAIINALNTKPFLPTGLAMGSLATMMTGLQIAAITANKPVKGYEKGLYPNMFEVIREQDGKPFQASYGGTATTGLVGKPTVFMAGENGVEMIIDSKTFRNFTPELKYDLAKQTPTVRGYEDGFYKESNQSSTDNKMLLEQNLLVMQQNAALINMLLENGVQAYMVMDYAAMRNFKKVEENYTNHQNKNKI